MYEAPYFRSDGTAGAAVTLPSSLFNGVVHAGALHQVVRAHLANRRAGTAAKKNRSRVAGGGRKPWRQKGTGRARQGTIRAVQWRGGGLAFPPRPRSWRQRVPRRVRALARISAFNSRASEGRVAVIESFDFAVPKTRELASLLARIGMPGKSLLLTSGVNRALYLSSRNLPGARVLPFGAESPYDVVWSGSLIIEEAALESLEEAVAGRERSSGRRPVRSTDEEPAALDADGGEE